MISTGTVLYLIVGMLYAWRERRMFEDIDFDTDKEILKILYAIQISVHFFRLVITWPLYSVEDFIVFLTNVIIGDDGDIGGPYDDLE